MEEAVIKDFEQACENAELVQHELLMDILKKNSECEYLKRYGKPLRLEAFKAQVPLVSYDDVVSDIQRVADGDTSPILCLEPITHFVISSGTSSWNHKILPQTKLSGVQFRPYMVSEAYRTKLFAHEPGKPVGLNFSYCMNQFKSRSGLLIGALSTNFFNSESFKNTEISSTTPCEVTVSASDWRQTTYCHLLFGLLHRHKVNYISALFAYTLLEALRILRLEWEELCEDISTGCLNKKITDEKLRSPVTQLLKPSKELADDVRNICSRKSWDGIIQLLWPRAKYVTAIVTGAMQPYVPSLKKHAGELPIVGLDYACSEGCIGINVSPASPPEEVVFTITPYSVFFEFIPVEAPSQNCIVGVGEVQVGKEYEIVITTHQGLYRYRVGDVVKVTGFFYGAPQVAFSYRKNVALSITMDRVDEQELQDVILEAVKVHGLEVANFTSYADFTSEPPHYVILWELESLVVGENKDESMQECCEAMDTAFNMLYIAGRANRTIGPLELAVVHEGTFEKLMEHAVGKGASPMQYKFPRCVTSPALLELLKDGTAYSYKSMTKVHNFLAEKWKPKFAI